MPSQITPSRKKHRYPPGHGPTTYAATQRTTAAPEPHADPSLPVPAQSEPTTRNPVTSQPDPTERRAAGEDATPTASASWLVRQFKQHISMAWLIERTPAGKILAAQ